MNRYTIKMLLGKLEEMREEFQALMDAEEPDVENLENKLDDFSERCKEVGNYAYKESPENNLAYSLACGADYLYSMLDQVGIENDVDSLLENSAKAFFDYAANVLKFASCFYPVQ